MSNVSKRPLPWQWPLVTLMTILLGLWLPASCLGQTTQPLKRSLVEVRTELGNMMIALYNETPKHRDHFLRLVEEGAYDSLLFHRIVPGFAIEGGDPGSKHAEAGVALGLDTDTVGLPLEVVPGRLHKKGALSAAPAGSGAEAADRSHGSRFFIVQGTTYDEQELNAIASRNAGLGTPFSYSDEDKRTYASIGGQPRLDGGYTVFGEVVDGLEVIEALAKQPCNQWDRPLKDIRMYMRILK